MRILVRRNRLLVLSYSVLPTEYIHNNHMYQVMTDEGCSDFRIGMTVSRTVRLPHKKFVAINHN